MMLEEVFCSVDDFCRVFVPKWRRLQLGDGKKHRNRKACLSISEMVTILILFHSSGYRTFKHFYLWQVCHGSLKSAFPKAPSYSRFVAWIPRVFPFLCAFLQSIKKQDSTGIHFIDSTSIAVCRNKRTGSHRVFRGLAAIGKTTMGWFYGFKLHLICDDNGNLCDCLITPGNVDDRKNVDKISKNIKGKLFGDKGYISQKLAASLLQRGLKLITGLRANMKNRFLLLKDKILLRKRSLIETLFGQLKNVLQMQHTRHRNPLNGFGNIVAALIAFYFHPNKPKIHFKPHESRILGQNP